MNHLAYKKILIIICFLIDFAVIVLKVDGQVLGYINEQGDSIVIRDVFNASQWSLCQGRCYQFLYIEHDNRPEHHILYDDSIFWRFKLGLPRTSNERDPIACFPELGGPDTIEMLQKFRNIQTGTTHFTGQGHRRVHVIKCSPEANFEPDRHRVCEGHPIEYIDSSIMAPDEWIWEFEGGEPPVWSGPDPPPVYYDYPGVYTTSLSVANEAGSDTMIKTQVIEVVPGPRATTDWVDYHELPFGDDVRLRPCSIGETYQWTPADGLSCTDCPSPTLTVGHTSQYRLVVGLDGQECFDTCDYRIDVLPVDEPIWFPNAFTPNGDGINDTFGGFGPFVEVEELRIYDRWGNELFIGHDQTPWDGRHKGQLVEPGTYVYFAIYKKLFSQETDIVRGEVAVFR